MIRITLAATALAALSFPAQAVTVAQWDFEHYTPPTGAVSIFGGIAPSTSVGLLALGSVLHQSAAIFSTPSGNGSTQSLSAPSWSVFDNWYFTFSTVGYSGVSIAFDQAGSATGPRDFTASYSLDAITFTALGNYPVVLSNWNPGARSAGFYEFKLPAAASNAPTVYVMLRNVSTVAINGATVTADGTDRIDNFTVSATPVPEPGTSLLMACGVAWLALRRRAGRAARKLWHAASALGLMACAMAVQAQPAFQGRLADGSPSSTCTVSGAGKCTSFYAAALDLTILNNWRIGEGYWSATAAAGSVQALAEAAGLAATGLSGWRLPTADADQPEGALNQYRAIWYAAGGSALAMPAQFDGVQTSGFYFSSSVTRPTGAWAFSSQGGFTDSNMDVLRFAVAVRPGDVAAVPEPQQWALALLGLVAVARAVNRRRQGRGQTLRNR